MPNIWTLLDASAKSPVEISGFVTRREHIPVGSTPASLRLTVTKPLISTGGDPETGNKLGLVYGTTT